MSIDDSNKPTSSQIEHLNEKNYRSWLIQVRVLLRHQRILDVVDGISPKSILTLITAESMKNEIEAHKELIDA